MGRDKAALVIDGEQLAERTAHLLLELAKPVIEIGPGYTSLPHTREDPPGSGPLAALAAGRAALDHRGHFGPVLVLGTDLPRLTAQFLQRLAEHPAPTPEHCVVPRDAHGRAQPVCARYSWAGLSRAPELVAAGHRSLMALLQQVPVTWLDLAPGDEGVLHDVDTPEDLAQLSAEGARVARAAAAAAGSATAVPR